MRYDDPLLCDMLAAEYVLGTLRGRARRRFEALMQTRPEWRAAMYWWSDRLNLIGDTALAVNPPRRVWKNIEIRLFGRKVASHISWWRGMAIASFVSAVLLAMLMVSKPLLPTSNVAVLTDTQTKSAWVLAVQQTKGKNILHAATLAGLSDVPGKSFELWLLPSNNAKPISLGLLPKQGELKWVISDQVGEMLIAGNLAVSLEPLGGSPTGQPTGDVLYQGKLQQL